MHVDSEAVEFAQKLKNHLVQDTVNPKEKTQHDDSLDMVELAGNMQKGDIGSEMPPTPNLSQ